MVRTRIGNFRVLFDVIFNPRNLIDSSSRYTNQSVAERLKTLISVTIFFFFERYYLCVTTLIARDGVCRRQFLSPVADKQQQ